MLNLADVQKIVDRAVKAIVQQLGDRLAPQATTRQVGAATMPATWSKATVDIAAAGSATGDQVDLAGRSIVSLLSGDAGGIVEVAFGDPGDASSATATNAGNQTITREWFPLIPGGHVDAPGGTRFVRFRVRLATGTLATAAQRVILATDVVPGGQTIREAGRFANVSPGGSISSLTRIVRGSDGAEATVEGGDGSVASRATPAVAGHVQGGAATAFKTIDVDAAGRLNTNPIAAQTGVAAGAGVTSALTQRTVEASDGPVSTSLVTLAARATGAGVSGATVQRTVEAVAATWAPSQVNVTNAATVLAAANPTRSSLTVTNETGVTIYLGAAGVTTGTGIPLATGHGQTFAHDDAVYAIAAAAGPYAVGVSEETS